MSFPPPGASLGRQAATEPRVQRGRAVSLLVVGPAPSSTPASCLRHDTATTRCNAVRRNGYPAAAHGYPLGAAGCLRAAPRGGVEAEVP